MNHPKPEEWVPYLYGELGHGARRQLNLHLAQCSECRGRLNTWRRDIGRLDAWKLPRTSSRWPGFVPALKWAAAAALVLAVGFVAGRLTGGERVAEQVRAALEPQLRAALRQEIAQMVRQEVGRGSSALLAASGEQAEKLLAAYNTINETHRAEDMERLYLALKKQLDTVAVNTQQEFVQLANYHENDPTK